MKALSIRQPWAWLIVHGPKRIENRSWFTRHRGPLLIHASKGFSKAEYDVLSAQVLEHCGIVVPDRGDLHFGGIIGRCQLIEVVSESEDPWFEGPFGFVLTDVEPVPFVAVAGALRIFEVDPAMLSAEPDRKDAKMAKQKTETAAKAAQGRMAKTADPPASKPAGKPSAAGKPAGKPSAGSKGAAKPSAAAKPPKLAADERGMLKEACAVLGKAEAGYKNASKAKKAAQDALTKLVGEIADGAGPLFEKPAEKKQT